MASSIQPRACSTRPVTSIFNDPVRSTPPGLPLRVARTRTIVSSSRMPEQNMSLSSANAERLKQAFQQCRDMEGSLREQLEAYAAAGREIFPAYGEAVDRLVARLNENGGGENAPRPGEAMPPFLLPDETGRLVSLNSLTDRGPVAVMFYRGHWCPYCRLNVRAVIQAQDRIKALGGQVVAIIPEMQEYAEKFKS